jgi:hypothetical protein
MSINLLAQISSAVSGGSAAALPNTDFHKHAAHRGAHGPAQTTAELLSSALGSKVGELPVGVSQALLKAGARATHASGRPVSAATPAGTGGAAPAARGSLLDAKA